MITTEMIMAFIIGMWLGMGLLKLSELIIAVYRKRALKKMMESLLHDLENLNKTVELMKKEEEQKEEKVKKPRAKKTQK